MEPCVSSSARIRWPLDLIFGLLCLGATSSCANPVGSDFGREAVSTIAAGGQSTCALTVGGVAYCWGRGDDGQLGDNSRKTSFAPRRVAGQVRFSTIDVGFYHACALDSAGAAYCWGAAGRSQNAGQLGTGSASRGSDSPVRVASPLRFATIGAGQMHTCALTSDGLAYCWGGNHLGQLGDGSLISRALPVPVAGGHRFAQLALGDSHTCGVTPGGEVLCWGDNLAASVTGGEHTSDTCADGGDRRCTRLPFPVPLPERARSVDAGSASCMTTPANASYCWGGDVRFHVPVRRVAGDYQAIAVGSGHQCGMSESSLVSCWGANRLGQLGNGSSDPDHSATPIAMAGNLRLSVVSAAMFHTCGVTLDGAAYCWGGNREGQLGAGTDLQLTLCGNSFPCSGVPLGVRRR